MSACQKIRAKLFDINVRRVPELYQEMIDGKRDVKIGDKSLNLKSLDAKASAELVGASGSCGSRRESLTQQPALFDFRRNRAEERFINLP